MGRNVLTIRCSKIGKAGLLPEKYTFQGSNINPPLIVENIPPDAKSLAVILESNIHNGVIKTHWVAWNIPISGGIKENEDRGETGPNDFGGIGYWGPFMKETPIDCTFRVYALDRFFNNPNSISNRYDLQRNIIFYGLGHGSLVCKYAIEKVPELTLSAF